ncbi:MAG: hypothetical protein LBS63_02100 [Prevotellaceae bacterium]|jgi:hypothetical protein|nr:hypothetical protein [Prevotellaceae bacterium]
MKKVFMAMALVCGAAAFVTACGDDEKETPAACTCKVYVKLVSGSKVPSVVYTDGCASKPSEGADVTGADAGTTEATGKSGKYTLEGC